MMTRTNWADVEVKEQKRRDDIAKATLGGLEEAVGRMGGELTGVTFKVGEYDVLGVLKAEFPGGAMVSFVGAASIGAVLHKAMQEGQRDNLTWKTDQYRT